MEAENSLTEIGSITSGKEAARTRFHYCQNSHEILLYIRAMQAHSGGEAIEPEMIFLKKLQDQDKEHSQGERSEDRTAIRLRVWEDLSANEYNYGYKWETQVSKFVSKLVRHEHSVGNS